MKKSILFLLLTCCLAVSLPAVSDIEPMREKKCTNASGMPLRIPGCCGGKRYNPRPDDPSLDFYPKYSYCCAGNIVDEFDATKYKCCEKGKLRGQVVLITQGCE